MYDEITAKAVDSLGTDEQSDIDGFDIDKLQDVDFGGWEVIRPNSDEQKDAHSILKYAAREDDEAMVESSLRPSEVRGDGLTEAERRYNDYYFKARERLGSQTPPASLRPPYSPRPFTRNYPQGRIYYESYKDSDGEYRLFRAFIDLNGDGYVDGKKYFK